jgi:transcriptional regulator with XRE-family HTH domain
MMPGMGNVLDELRKAIEASGESRYRLWKATGISQSHLSRLMRGEAGLSVDNLERLADALGLEITIRPAKAKASKSKGR